MANLVKCESCGYYPVEYGYICTKCGIQQSKGNKPVIEGTSIEQKTPIPKTKKNILKPILIGLAFIILIALFFVGKYFLVDNRLKSNQKATINTIPQVDTTNILIAVICQNGKWGFIGNDFKPIISPQFDNALGFSEGLACVKVKDKWGFINVKGEFVIQPIFYGPGEFHQGLAKVEKLAGGGNGSSRFYYINTKGENVFNVEYHYATDFNNGTAQVEDDRGKSLFIDLHGKEISKRNEEIYNDFEYSIKPYGGELNKSLQLDPRTGNPVGIKYDKQNSGYTDGHPLTGAIYQAAGDFKYSYLTPQKYFSTIVSSKNYLNGKTFNGTNYKIQIDNIGRIKMYAKSDSQLYFESSLGKQFEIGIRKNDGRWITIEGTKWNKGNSARENQSQDFQLEFVLLKNGTLILPMDNGNIYSIANDISDKSLESKADQPQVATNDIPFENLTLTEAICDGENCAFIFKDKAGNEWQSDRNLPQNNVITFEKNSDGKKQVKASLINKQFLVKYKREGDYDNGIEVLDIKGMDDNTNQTNSENGTESEDRGAIKKPEGTWVVLLGTFENVDNAKTLYKKCQKSNIEVDLVNTNTFEKLKKDCYSLCAGTQLSESSARDKVSSIKSKGFDAFAKDAGKYKGYK